MPATSLTAQKNKRMLHITCNAPLKPLNTMGIDGTADALVEWGSASDLHTFFTDPAYESISHGTIKAIGQGSNLLFTVYRYEGAILRCTDTTIETIAEDENTATVRVHAGCVLDNLAKQMCDKALWGTENLSLIPGTVAGATVQNVGAYGAEIGTMVKAVHCYDRQEKREVILSHDDMAYGYRDSALKHEPLKNRLIVVATDIVLSKKPCPKLSYGNLHRTLSHLGDHITPLDVREEVIRTRRGKLPEVTETGSAGSFFKNPVVSPRAHRQVIEAATNMGIDTSTMPAHETITPNGEPGIKLSAAWLIDKSGWKGYRRWNVGTWPTQPLVLVNLTGYAAGIEITALARDIIADVRAKWGITLTPEVEYL